MSDKIDAVEAALVQLRDARTYLRACDELPWSDETHEETRHALVRVIDGLDHLLKVSADAGLRIKKP